MIKNANVISREKKMEEIKKIREQWKKAREDEEIKIELRKKIAELKKTKIAKKEKTSYNKEYLKKYIENEIFVDSKFSTNIKLSKLQTLINKVGRDKLNKHKIDIIDIINNKLNFQIRDKEYGEAMKMLFKAEFIKDIFKTRYKQNEKGILVIDRTPIKAFIRSIQMLRDKKLLNKLKKIIIDEKKSGGTFYAKKILNMLIVKTKPKEAKAINTKSKNKSKKDKAKINKMKKDKAKKYETELDLYNYEKTMSIRHGFDFLVDYGIYTRKEMNKFLIDNKIYSREELNKFHALYAERDRVRAEYRKRNESRKEK